MNRMLYKNTFNSISVSEKTINDLILKVNGNNIRSWKKSIFRISVPIAAVLVASLITVSAASGKGIAETFRGFFTQFFETQLTDKQLSLIEKYGTTPDKEFSKGGVHLNIDGVLADHSIIYLKYSIWADKGYNPIDYSLIMSRKLYMGDTQKGIKLGMFRSESRIFTQDKSDPNKFYYTAVVNLDKDRAQDEKNATFVLKSDERYHATEVDLKNAYNKSGENKKLNIKLDTQYGRIILECVSYDNGRLKIGVDSSGYYENPKFYLRDKSSGKIYCPYNGYEEIDKILFNAFEVNNIDMLSHLELVMPEEYQLSFPISYVKPKTIDLKDKAYVKYGQTKIDQIKVSPLSISISGRIPKDYASAGSKDFNIGDCSIRLKDKTIIGNFKYAGEGYETKDNSFVTDISFDAPIDTDDLEALIIKKAYKSEKLEIPLK